MEITTKEVGNVAIVKVSGRIENVNAVNLCKLLEGFNDTNVSQVVLNISEVEFIDSSGLGGLIYSNQILKKKNKTLALAGMIDTIKDLFRDCSFAEKFEIVDCPDFN